MAKRTIIGVKEYVTLLCDGKEHRVLARIDTGASKSSMDRQLARELCVGPVLRYRTVKSATGITKRPVVLARIRIAGRTFKAYFTLADRKHMKYAVLIGRNILKQGFLIDPTRKLR